MRIFANRPDALHILLLGVIVRNGAQVVCIEVTKVDGGGLDM
jgi:hypothetical protein